MAMQLNPPPGWPPAPAGWTPPPGWQPDPTWPPPPPGWQLWMDTHAPTGGNDGEDGEQASREEGHPRPPLHPRKRIVTVIAGSVLAVIAVLAIIGAITGADGSGSGSGDGSPSATSILESDGYTPNPGLLSANVSVGLVVGLASQPGIGPPLSTAAGLNADQNVEVVLVFQSSSEASAYDQANQIAGVGTDTVRGSVVTVTGSSDDFDFDCGATGVPPCTPI